MFPLISQEKIVSSSNKNFVKFCQIICHFILFDQFPDLDTKNTINNPFLSIFYYKNYYHDHQILCKNTEVLFKTTTNELKALLHQVPPDISPK